MQKTFWKTIPATSTLALSLALSGCGDQVTSTTNSNESSTSTTSSSGTGGSGGESTSSTGGTGGAGGAGGAGTGGQGGNAPICDKPMNNPCFECAYDQCSDIFCNCKNSNPCSNILPCIQQCPAADNFCRNICYQNNSIGLAEFMELSNCAGTTCLASCPKAEPVAACQLCLAQSCEQELEACFGNPTCTALIDCIRTCPPNDMVCTNQCATDHAAGLNQATQLNNCSKTSCTNVCN